MIDRRRLAFLFLNLGHFYDHLFMLIYATVAALALPAAFGLEYGELIVYATPGFVAFGAFALPAGWLADRWSRRGMLSVFFLGIGAASMLTGFARTPMEIGAGLLLIGVFAAIYHPVGITMVVETHREKTGMALGINGVWGNMGVACAAVFTGTLIDLGGWRAAFWLPGAVAMLTGAGYLWLCATAARAPLTEARASDARSRSPAVDRGTFVRVLLVIALTTTLGSFIFQATTVTLPKVFDERLQNLAISATAVGGWAFAVFAVASLAQILIGHLVDRHSIRSVFAVVAGLQIPAYLLVVDATGAGTLLGSLVFMLLVFGQIPINDALLSRFSTPQYRGRLYALKFVLSFAVAALALPLVGYLHRSTGFEGMFALLSAVALAIFLAVLTLPRVHGVIAPAPATAR